VKPEVTRFRLRGRAQQMFHERILAFAGELIHLYCAHNFVSSQL
jgi:hypothetical protein